MNDVDAPGKCRSHPAIAHRHLHRSLFMDHMKFTFVVPALCALCVPLLLAQELPFEPTHDIGQSITGAYEGWFQNPDGTYSFLVGYFNRNQKQTLDIPAGPDNQ